MHSTSTVLRPCVSPQCPRTKAPIGRATYPTPKVANDATMATCGLSDGKKMFGKTSAAACA